MSKYGFDKFYTNEKTVLDIMANIDLEEYDTIIEPSAGNGSFSKLIPNVLAYDIKPEDDSIKQQDFLKLKHHKAGRTLTIGNPPFGRNGSLALSFIKHACTFSDTVAFILPKSFKKKSFYDKIPLSFIKVFEKDLDDNSFTFEGELVDIPCVFQIYNKTDTVREKKNRLTTPLFDFVKKEEANVSIRRVGVYAGKAFLSLDKSPSSHYFIKVDNPVFFVENVNAIIWGHNNTVGPRSISKPELIIAIELLLDKN